MIREIFVCWIVIYYLWQSRCSMIFFFSSLYIDWCFHLLYIMTYLTCDILQYYINTHKFIISLYIILPMTISCLFCFLFSFSQILVFFHSLPRIYHIFLSIKLSYFLIYQKFHESFFYKHPFTSLVRIL